MATATFKTGTFACLLVFAVICCGAGSAWAQLDCPLPDGVAPPAPLPITAQEVESGAASLMDYLLIVRERSSQPVASREEASYNSCVFRQEGSPYRSGSTYFVILTPDGRVLLNAKDMSLAGRLLNPAIYGTILQALGINPAELVSPAAAVAAFSAAAAGNGAPFNVPGFPGASGYAAGYHTRGFAIPNILLGGFDIDESHLVPIEDENIDYGDPSITAEEVVDRATLKEFVTAAGEYAVELVESGDAAAQAKSRIAARDPDGPWRHGSVYFYVLDTVGDVILLHGAFPDRYELRPLVPIARDVVTGELVLPQVIAAAESSPEGGFVDYFFDDPADDSDRADILKTGYARVFSGATPRPDGTPVPFEFIVGSGFYLTDDSGYVQRLLGALDDGQESIMFATTAPGHGDVVAGEAVDVSVEGAPTDAVHFAYRLAGAADAPFAYAGAARSRDAMASFAWDTTGLSDDDYELVALYTEDDGHSVIYDAIEVSVDNVADVGGGGGGCVAMPVLPSGGGPLDPTLPALVGIVLAWLMLGRRRQMRQAAGA